MSRIIFFREPVVSAFRQCRDAKRTDYRMSSCNTGVVEFVVQLLPRVHNQIMSNRSFCRHCPEAE